MKLPSQRRAGTRHKFGVGDPSLASLCWKCGEDKITEVIGPLIAIVWRGLRLARKACPDLRYQRKSGAMSSVLSSGRALPFQCRVKFSTVIRVRGYIWSTYIVPARW